MESLIPIEVLLASVLQSLFDFYILYRTRLFVMNANVPASVPGVAMSSRALTSLQTPCLLLDAEKMHRNIERMRNRLAGHGLDVA